MVLKNKFNLSSKETIFLKKNQEKAQMGMEKGLVFCREYKFKTLMAHRNHL